MSCVAVDPEPDSGAEGGEDPAAAGADAAGDRGDSASAAASQQRVLHTELPEQKTLLHLVVMRVYSLIIVAFSVVFWEQTRVGITDDKHVILKESIASFTLTLYEHTQSRVRNDLHVKKTMKEKLSAVVKPRFLTAPS